jgi:hypothetical protein
LLEDFFIKFTTGFPDRLDPVHFPLTINDFVSGQESIEKDN